MCKRQYRLNVFFLIISFAISGCTGIQATQETPPPEGYKEIRCSCLKGDGRYGSLTQYMKGKGDFCKLTVYGDFVEGTHMTCKPGSTEIKVNYPGTADNQVE